MEKVFYDFDTKNDSFINMVQLLKDDGVENNKFFLTLRDTSLRDLDPHSDNLTKEQKLKIILECINNPWYFFREIMRVPVSGSKEVAPFNLNRANLASIWCYFNSIDHFKQAPRDTYTTTTNLSIVLYDLFYTDGIYDLSYRSSILNSCGGDYHKLKTLIPLLPKYFHRDMNFIDRVKYFDSNIKKSIDADNISRSIVGGLTVFENFEFMRYNNILLGNSIVGRSTAKEESNRKNIPSCTIISSVFGQKDDPSTFGQKDDPSTVFSKFISECCCPWNQKFYDKDKEDVMLYIKGNSMNDMVHILFRGPELGKTDK